MFSPIVAQQSSMLLQFCVQYCGDAGFEETVALAQKLNDSLKLDENDQARLTNIAGREAFHKQSAAS